MVEHAATAVLLVKGEPMAINEKKMNADKTEIVFMVCLPQIQLDLEILCRL